MPETFFYVATLICVAVVGGVVGFKLRLPVGAMLGSMAAVIAFNVLVEPPIVMPTHLQFLLQLAAGPMIGARIVMGNIYALRKAIFPAVLMIVTLIILNIIFGLIIFRFSSMDLATALFATAPGGMMDMAIISMQFDANPAHVALLQLSRLMFIFIFMVPFFRKAIRKMKKSDKANAVQTEVKLTNSMAYSKSTPAEVQAMSGIKKSIRYKYFFITFISGAALGLPLHFIGVPAGAMIGAMIGAAAYNIISNKAYFPPGLRSPIQIIAGIFIGMRLDRTSLFSLYELGIPLLILFATVIAMTVCSAFVMHKIGKLDASTSLLSSTPGGLTEMAMLADDINADSAKVAVLQTARLITVIVLFPTILALLLRLVDWLW